MQNTKKIQRLVHAQILLSKYPESSSLGLEMEQLLQCWEMGLVEGEIKEPMHTLFILEESFINLLAYLRTCKAHSEQGEQPRTAIIPTSRQSQ
jgi:hypothetical protein